MPCVVVCGLAWIEASSSEVYFGWCCAQQAIEYGSAACTRPHATQWVCLSYFGYSSTARVCMCWVEDLQGRFRWTRARPCCSSGNPGPWAMSFSSSHVRCCGADNAMRCMAGWLVHMCATARMQPGCPARTHVCVSVNSHTRTAASIWRLRYPQLSSDS